MKKLLIVVAAIVVALAVCAPAWGQTIVRGDIWNPPANPPGSVWRILPLYPDLAIKAKINGKDVTSSAASCILKPPEGQGLQADQETACLYGAIRARAEVFFKIVGPRPSGCLLAELSRSTPSRVEVWVWREGGDETVNYYLVAAVPAVGPDLEGLKDSYAFCP